MCSTNGYRFSRGTFLATEQISNFRQKHFEYQHQQIDNFQEVSYLEASLPRLEDICSRMFLSVSMAWCVSIERDNSRELTGCYYRDPINSKRKSVQILYFHKSIYICRLKNKFISMLNFHAENRCEI